MNVLSVYGVLDGVRYFICEHTDLEDADGIGETITEAIIGGYTEIILEQIPAEESVFAGLSNEKITTKK